ncbi:MAG: hypothetical protein OXI67_05090 [Candidatus Poribacteria bacterium]|nr:hypothetical protein [Candidatus Poribacteria bacterium]
MVFTIKRNSTCNKIKEHTFIYLICLFLSLIFTSSIQAQQTNLTKKFGIGSQGATPAFGGMSFRYNGLAPVYLQTVGRFILNDQDGDHMLGAGVSYAIFEHRGKWNEARLYFTLEGGWRYKTQTDLEKEITKTTTLAAGISFGGELVFSLGGIPLGLNLSIGQGIGTENDNSQSKGIAGVYVGAGIHAYF